MLKYFDLVAAPRDKYYIGIKFAPWMQSSSKNSHTYTINQVVKVMEPIPKACTKYV